MRYAPQVCHPSDSIVHLSGFLQQSKSPPFDAHCFRSFNSSEETLPPSDLFWFEAHIEYCLEDDEKTIGFVALECRHFQSMVIKASRPARVHPFMIKRVSIMTLFPPYSEGLDFERFQSHYRIRNRSQRVPFRKIALFDSVEIRITTDDSL